MELLLIWIVMGGIVVAMIAASKGRSGGAWFLYGAAVWPIALVHILLTPRPTVIEDSRVMEAGDHRRCPYCAELIRREAIVCKHCGRDVGPEAAASVGGSAGGSAGAPQTVTAPLAVGARVEHGRHGPGRITDLGPLAVTVEFDRAGVQVVPRGGLRLIVEG